MFDQRPSAGTVAERNEGLEGWNKLGRGPTTARVTEPCRETCTPANAIVRGKLCSYPSSPPCISLLSSLSSCSQPVYTHNDAFSLTGPFHAVGHGVIVIVCRGSSGKCVDESDHVEFQNNLNIDHEVFLFFYSLVCCSRHNDLPWNIRKFLKNQLREFRFDDLRDTHPWSRSAWSHTDLRRLKEGMVAAQVSAMITATSFREKTLIRWKVEPRAKTDDIYIYI